MNKIKILLADNDRDFLKTREQIIEAEGYEVIPANGVEEAERMLESTKIDLAIVDLRLRDDNDEYDLSGQNIVKNIAPHVPKIILTQFPTTDAVRKALGGDSVRAVDFIDKNEGKEVLLRAISAAVKDHVLREKESRRLRYAVMMGMGLLLFIGALYLFWEQGLTGVAVAFVIGIASQGIVQLFFYFMDKTNRR